MSAPRETVTLILRLPVTHTTALVRPGQPSVHRIDHDGWTNDLIMAAEDAGWVPRKQGELGADANGHVQVVYRVFEKNTSRAAAVTAAKRLIVDERKQAALGLRLKWADDTLLTLVDNPPDPPAESTGPAGPSMN